MGDVTGPETSEVEINREPAFLASLEVDYPELANKIRTDLPRWVSAVEGYLGIAGIAKTVLDKVHYFSKEDTRLFVTRVADEVKTIPVGESIVFVHHASAARSGRFLYDEIVKRLGEDSSRIRLAASADLQEVVEKDINKKHIFFIDDSANSGQQLNLCLNPLIAVSDLGESTEVHVRLMAITKKAKDTFNWLKSRIEDDSGDVVLDIQADDMPVVGEPPEGVNQNRWWMVATPHHGRGRATLGIFSHRLQDNLSPLLIEGIRTEGMGEIHSDMLPGIFPLLNPGDIPEYSPL